MLKYKLTIMILFGKFLNNDFVLFMYIYIYTNLHIRVCVLCVCCVVCVGVGVKNAYIYAYVQLKFASRALSFGFNPSTFYREKMSLSISSS